MSDCYYYKLVRVSHGRLKSIFVHREYKWLPAYDYEPNETIKSKDGDGPITAFDSIENLLNFWRSFVDMSDRYRVYTCTGKKSSEKGIYRAYVIECRYLKQPVYELPQGTVLLSEVTLHDMLLDNNALFNIKRHWQGNVIADEE